MLRSIVTSAALCFALLLSACPGAQTKEQSGEVGVKLRRVDVTTASFEEMQLTIVVLVENQTSSSVSITGGEGKLMLAGPAQSVDDDGDAEEEASDDGEDVEDDEDDEETMDDVDGDDDMDDDMDDGADASGVASGEWVTGKAAGGSCEAFSECEVTIPVTLPLPDDAAALEELLGWGRMTVQTEGTLKLGPTSETWGGPREIAAPELPKPVLEEAQLASLDEGEKGSAYFVLGIDNPNVFPIKVDKFDYSITVGTTELKEMGAGDVENVPPSSVSSFEDSLELNEETLGKKEVKELLSQQAVPYVVVGVMVIRGIEREFRFEGEMEFAR